ncbi:UN93L-like protein [Mya arenaria]|uniref:UN93L-like protein n=1 Tax=Mya arenaria TaxID=6604 RepID=A0ABY7EUW6_MYAAR|nr:UN93L-like protein [Mya arenaria]
MACSEKEQSESINLVAADNANQSENDGKSKEINCNDYDSLNNLIFLESDADSFYNDGKVDVRYSDEYKTPGNRSNGILSLHGSRRSVYQSDENSNSLSSRLSFQKELRKHRFIVNKGLQEGSRDTETSFKMNSKKSIWRSFISLCTGLMFAFMSFMPLRNIQTSLYPMKQLGNLSLAAMYISFAVGCLFSNWITQNARPKGIILIAVFGHVVYCAANVYPSLYSLLPASCFFGFFHAPLWTTQELMIASYGASYTAISQVHIDKAVHQFQSVFLVFCHAAQVLGNLVESAVLHCGDTDPQPVNMTMYMSRLENDIYEGIEITNISHEVYSPKQLVWMGPFGYKLQPDVGLTSGDKPNFENILKFVFISFAVMGMTIICLFLNKPDIIIHKRKTSLCEKLRNVRRFMTTGTFFSLFPLMLFSGMQQAIYGTLTLGLSMVGYMMMCYGTCQLVVLLLVEKVHNQLKTSVAIFNAFLVSLGLLVWLYIWEPGHDELLKVIAYVGIWGAVDGLWQSQVQNVLLSWSVGRRDAAVTVFRTVQSLGLALVFLLDVYVTLLNMICVCCGVLVVGVILYLLLEVVRSPQISAEPLPFAL